jgi:hypothetical protein
MGNYDSNITNYLTELAGVSESGQCEIDFGRIRVVESFKIQRQYIEIAISVNFDKRESLYLY